MMLFKRLTLAGLSTACLVAFATASASPRESADDEAARAAITKAARDYVEGWYTADAERLDRALHPDLHKVRVVRLQNGKDILSRQTADVLTKGRVGAKGEPEAPEIEVSILSISADTASVEIVSPSFVDFAHIAKIDGAWVVVNVLWHVVESGE